MSVVEIRSEGIDQALNMLGSLGKFFRGDRQLISEILSYQNFKIKDRTQKGKDSEGDYFKPYSRSYKKFREKTGRQTRRVDLNFSGRMLAGMVNRTVSGREGHIYFASPEDAKKAAYNQKTRNFFSVSKEEQEEITDMVANHIDELLIQAQRGG